MQVRKAQPASAAALGLTYSASARADTASAFDMLGVYPVNITHTLNCTNCSAFAPGRAMYQDAYSRNGAYYGQSGPFVQNGMSVVASVQPLESSWGLLGPGFYNGQNALGTPCSTVNGIMSPGCLLYASSSDKNGGPYYGSYAYGGPGASYLNSTAAMSSNGTAPYASGSGPVTSANLSSSLLLPELFFVSVQCSNMSDFAGASGAAFSTDNLAALGQYRTYLRGRYVVDGYPYPSLNISTTQAAVFPVHQALLRPDRAGSNVFVNSIFSYGLGFRTPGTKQCVARLVSARGDYWEAALTVSIPQVRCLHLQSGSA